MRRRGKTWWEPTIGSVVSAIANRSEGPLAFGFVLLAFDFGRAFAFNFFLLFAIAISRGIRKTGGAAGKCGGYYPGRGLTRAFPLSSGIAPEIRRNHVNRMRLPQCSSDAASLPNPRVRATSHANQETGRFQAVPRENEGD